MSKKKKKRRPHVKNAELKTEPKAEQKTEPGSAPLPGNEPAAASVITEEDSYTKRTVPEVPAAEEAGEAAAAAGSDSGVPAVSEAEKGTEGERLIYLDLLRIIATIGVIILHIASKEWWNVNDYRSGDWNAYNVWDSLTRWTVPIFVMISGALFLDNRRRITVKSLWSQNILRIFSAFAVWSVVYTIYDVCGREGDFGVRTVTVTDVHGSFIEGYYHLWYMYMIIGLYVLVPLLRKISADMSLVKYFLAASLFFTFLFPNIKNIGNLNIYYSYGSSVYLEWYKSFDINMVIGYIAYFFLGYFLFKVDFTKLQRVMIYMLAVGGFAATMLLTADIYRISDFPNTIFYGNFSINVMMESVGIFVFVKNINWKPSAKAERLLVKLSSITFGVYLIHALVLDVLIEDLKFPLFEVENMYLAIPVLSVDVLLISSAISYALGKVPLVKKYAV